MAMTNLPIVGRQAAVSVAINADSVAFPGTTWDGVPGGYDANAPMPGGAQRATRQAQTVVAQLLVDEEFVIDGVRYYTATLKFPLAYALLEKYLQLGMFGTIATTGASVPYTHTITGNEKPLHGAVKIWYTDAAANANEIRSRLLTNCVSTAVSISQAKGKESELTVSLCGQVETFSKVEAALPSLTRIQPVTYKHLALTLDAVATYPINSLTIDVTNPINEGEGSMNSGYEDPGEHGFIVRKGSRSVLLKVNFDREENVEDNLTVGTLLEGTNTAIWNNAGATTANRQLQATFADLKVGAYTDQDGDWGILTREIEFRALKDSAGNDPLTLACLNERVTIPA